jgi:hypothetical protein
MKDHILIFGLAFILWAWINLRISRSREQILIHKETKEILLKKLTSKNNSGEKQGQKPTALKRMEDLSQATGKFKTNAYPYFQRERRGGKERRKSRVQVGLTFENVDRRRADSTKYKGFERRRGMDRRGNTWDRRKPKIACYS